MCYALNLDSSITVSIFRTYQISFDQARERVTREQKGAEAFIMLNLYRLL